MRLPKYRIKEIKKSVKRILIIYWSFFGDLLTTTPLLEALRRGFPRAHITYLLGGGGDIVKDGIKILEHNPCVDRYMRSDVSILARLLMDEPHDLMIDLCGNKTSGLITKASGAGLKVWGDFRTRPPYFFYSECLDNKWSAALKVALEDSMPRVERMLELARFFGADTRKDARPKIYLSRGERAFSRRYLKRIRREKRDIVIAIQPGGRAQMRLWEAKNYARFADRMIEKYNARVIILYARGEKAFAYRVQRAARHKLITIFEKDIRRYVSIIAGCDLFVSSDGGPLHIALSLGVPSVGIFKNRRNAAYWYDYERRKGLYPALVNYHDFKKLKKSRIDKIMDRETGLVLEKAQEALNLGTNHCCPK